MYLTILTQDPSFESFIPLVNLFFRTILACNLPNIQEDLQEMKLLLKSQYELLESPGEIGDYDTVYPYRRRRLSQQGATEFAEYQDVSKV